MSRLAITAYNNINKIPNIMKKQKTKLSHLLGLILSSSLIILSGCAHQLDVRNLDDYAKYRSVSLKKDLSIGLITESYDAYCQLIANGIGDSLNKYSKDVLILNNSSNFKKVDVVADVLITPDYKGSGWNFWINFPGFIVFAPAWNGYIYNVDYNVDIKLINPTNLEEIDSYNLPISLDVRHADMNRTWTEISWLEVGAIAFVGGLFFMQYDKSVSPLLAKDIERPIGRYIAQTIVEQINKSEKLAHTIRFNDNHLAASIGSK